MSPGSMLLQSSSSSSSLCARLFCSLAYSCQRSLWTASPLAADSTEPPAGSTASAQKPDAVLSSSHDAAAVLTQPHTADVQQQQLQQPQPVHQISSQVEQRDRSLHEQALYQMPQPGQPLPPLPRFRPRKVQQQPVPVLRALEVIKANARSGHTLEAHMRLKVDPRRGDQMVRGAAVLPVSWQTGLRIAVFAEGAAADDARAAGADVVGAADLVASILDSKGKSINFTACLATPDMMPQMVKLGRILGPKGLMPNPKMGTLTDDITGAIAELRQGRVEFKMDRTGIVHAPIGKASFDPHSLYLNLGALTGALLAVKPEAIKGGLVKYVRTAYLASSQGSSVPVDVASLADAVSAAAAAKAQKAATVARA